MLSPSTTLFEDAIDVPLWLEADRTTPYEERLRRDRGIARRVGTGAAITRVRRWWQHVPHVSHDSAGARLRRTRRLVTATMLLLGIGFGCAVALAAFHYDGSAPVNVVTLLALLVMAPLFFLLVTLLLAIGRQAGLRAIFEPLVGITPGAFAGAIYRRLAQPSRDAAQLFGWHAARSAAGGRFSRWQLLYWSQLAAVGFNAATITTGICLITFTDLAFGWSTTLGIDAATVDTIVRTLSLPWHDLLPSAVPDAALIEQSQFFRLTGTAELDAHASRTLAGWWSFVILAIFVYGLLPRLLLLALAELRLYAATRTLLLEDPRVTALRDRMDSPTIEMTATEPEHAHVDTRTPSLVHAPGDAGDARAVIWGASIERAAADAFARKRLRRMLTTVVDAGGDRSLGDDRAALQELCAGGGSAIGSTVVVFTRAWEPPLLELLDYLASLRRGLGPTVSIIVVPVPEPGPESDMPDAQRGITPTERATWARAISRLADPHLYVEAGT